MPPFRLAALPFIALSIGAGLAIPAVKAGRLSVGHAAGQPFGLLGILEGRFVVKLDAIGGKSVFDSERPCVVEVEVMGNPPKQVFLRLLSDPCFCVAHAAALPAKASR